MAGLRDLLARCDAEVRTHLDTDELVIAIGRCEDITQAGNPDLGGAGWTFVMVTDRNLRWVPRVNLAFEAALDLDDVVSATERLVRHRYALALGHTPISRLATVPAHRFLTFEWGNAVERLRFHHTELAFSRRDTRAAIALRDQLALRGTSFQRAAPRKR